MVLDWILTEGRNAYVRDSSFTWEIWNTESLLDKYIQVTEAECYTIDMDKNIPTRIYTDRLSDINAIFAPSWGEKLCAPSPSWREEGKSCTWMTDEVKMSTVNLGKREHCS